MQADGKLSSRKDGLRTFSVSGYFTDGEQNTFVSKRQPRPLKPGDKFTFEHGSDRNDVRTLVFMDDKSILYTKDRTGIRHCFPIIDGKNLYYGRTIRAS